MLGVRVFDEGVFRGEIVHVSNIVMGGCGGVIRFTTTVIFSDVVVQKKVGRYTFYLPDLNFQICVYFYVVDCFLLSFF